MDRFILKAIGLTKQYRLKTGSTPGYRENTSTFSAEIAGIFRKKQPIAGRQQTNQFLALEDVSFEVNPGDILGVIGRNGAGKSTLLKIISRVTEPTSGKALVYGRVGSLLEVGTGFHSELTGRENIFISGAIIGMTQAEIRKKFDEIVAFSGIEKFLELPVKRYSSGMEVRLAFSVAVHLRPELLLVDEVLSIGDAEFQNKSLAKIKEVADNGGAVLFISHNMNSVSTLCNQVMVLDHGKVAFPSGSVQNGIQFHHDLLVSGVSQTTSSGQERDPNAAVQITSFSLRDVYDNPVEHISTGQPITFHLSYKVNSPINGKNVYCVFTIHNTQGELLSMMTSDSPLDVSTAGAVRSVQCMLDRVPIAPAHIRLSATLESMDQVMDRLKNCYDGEIDAGGRINTLFGTTHTGILALDERWSYPGQ